MSRSARKSASRKSKQAKGESIIQRDKFIEERSQHTAPPVVAMNSEQKHYLRLLHDPEVKVIIVTGLFGTGKTYLASCVAGDYLKQKKIDKLIVSRAYIQTGKSSGLKPGTTLEKMYPYVRNVLDTVKKRIGSSMYDYSLKDGVSGAIEVQEVAEIRGRSFDEPTFLIIDEAQQTTPEEMLAIVTRVGDDCKLILCGDLQQSDIRGKSGLEWFENFADRHDIPGVGYVDFDSPDHIVRSGLVKDIAIGLKRDTDNGTKTPQS